MTGGIYCEAPLGTFYESKTLGDVNSRMRALFGAKLLDEVPLTVQIIDYWYRKVSRRMSKVLSTWKVPGNRGFYNRTVDLTRSICLGVYLDNKLRKMYRFTGGHREMGLTAANEYGTSPSSKSVSRMEWLGRTRHPDPAQRAQQFLNDYNLVYQHGYTLVIAATMPYAAILEHARSNNGMRWGYAIPVLSVVINRLLQDVYAFKTGNGTITKGPGGVIYGYIFESTGEFK